MASYLQVSDQRYTLTNNCNKPYVVFGNNKLPLITSTNTGTNTMNLHIVAGGGIITIEL